MPARPRPRECLDRWPQGRVRRGTDRDWGQRALDLAFVVGRFQERIETRGVKLQFLSDAAGIDRGTLNRVLTGDMWPGFHVMTSLSRVLYYPEVWGELESRQR